MNRMFFTAKYCLQELPLIVAQSATAGVGGMLIGVAVSSILKTDPLISCQNGCVITSCLVACLTLWETIKRSGDNQLTR